MPDDAPPNTPFRTPWEPARRVTHLGEYSSPAALRKDLLDLRQRVDAGQLGDLAAEDLALTIRELTEARDRLRGFARPTRGVLVAVAATFTGSGLLLAFLKMPTHAWLALGVAMVTAAVAALASELAQRWLDAVPEYEGLIADLRKLTTARPQQGRAAVSATDPRGGEEVAARAAAELATKHRRAAESALESILFWLKADEVDASSERSRRASQAADLLHRIEAEEIEAQKAAREAEKAILGSDRAVAARLAATASGRAEQMLGYFFELVGALEEMRRGSSTGVRVDARPHGGETEPAERPDERNEGRRKER